MKKITGLALLLILLLSCKTYVQVFETKSSDIQLEENAYVFENDSLQITYDFWAEKGLMTFTIFNKLDVPLYVDWKKSSYIDNSVKLNYWIDQEHTESKAYYESYYYAIPFVPGKTTEGTIVSSTTKAERITFIPPRSKYTRSQLYIYPYDEYKFNKTEKYTEVPRNDKPNKMTKVYELDYSKETSPIVFRNFLSFSDSENFEEEFYVDHEFYVSNIKEIDTRHFEQVKYDETKQGKWFLRDENGEVIMFSDFEKSSSFYLRVPDN